MSGEIVADDVDFASPWLRLDDGRDEGDKLIARMARHGAAEHLTRVGIERRIQGQCTVPVVLEPMLFRAAGGARQDRINPVERLNRRFLIDAEDDGALRRNRGKARSRLRLSSRSRDRSSASIARVDAAGGRPRARRERQSYVAPQAGGRATESAGVSRRAAARAASTPGCGPAAPGSARFVSTRDGARGGRRARSSRTGVSRARSLASCSRMSP